MADQSKRTGRARNPAINDVVAGTYNGTREIVSAIVAESVRSPAWRPTRAAAALAMAGENPPGPHEWMTTPEFMAWAQLHFPLRRHRTVTMQEAVGIAPTRRRALAAGAAVTKVEALAMAHYGAGRAAPIEPGDTAAFVDWFDARFGAARAITQSLELSESYILERLRGHATSGHGRTERLADVALIRALDWVWRVGSISPYGRRLPVQAFPGQKTED